MYKPYLLISVLILHFECRDILMLYCVYTMFPAAPAAPFARNVACRGVLVIHFSDFQDLLCFVTFLTLYYDIRNKPW